MFVEGATDERTNFPFILLDVKTPEQFSLHTLLLYAVPVAHRMNALSLQEMVALCNVYG
jgi:hypothetical protein